MDRLDKIKKMIDKANHKLDAPLVVQMIINDLQEAKAGIGYIDKVIEILQELKPLTDEEMNELYDYLENEYGEDVEEEIEEEIEDKDKDKSDEIELD